MAEYDKKISQFSESTYDGDCYVLVAKNGQSYKISGDDLASFVAGLKVYLGLNTTSQTLVGAINEVNTAISNLPSPMVFKGTLGVGGTIQTLPTAAASNEGWTYKVITAGTYAGIVAKEGDVFTSDGSTWVLIPAGDTDSDTWRAVKINGTEILGSGISTGALDIVAGTNMTITNVGGVVTFNVTVPTKTSDLTNDSGFVTIDDEVVSESKTWSSDKIRSELDSAFGVVYGFHIDSSESDPATAVTYLRDAVGMTPAHMDYTNNKFIWGSWKHAFFMPRPCMLNNDGTVAYYLDEDNYALKEDGTASDIANDAFAGNAMMEWGQNGQRIWYKIEPDTGDDTSASVYIANYKVDEDFHAWNFYDYNNILKEHFYTPIYNGSIVNDGTNDVLRSLSGKTYSQLCQSKTVAVEIQMAERNNFGADKGWHTEVFADVVLIQILCYLVGKSLNVQAVFGNGRINHASAASNMLGTGTMDDKGLFWGSNGNNDGVKIFGMENFWANQWRRYAGHYLVDNVNMFKLTRGTADGSTATDYSTSGATGYLTGGTSPSSNGYYSKMKFDSRGAFSIDSVAGGSASAYYCDYFYQNSGTRYALHGGVCSDGAVCGFYVYLRIAASDTSWAFGAAPSYK